MREKVRAKPFDKIKTLEDKIDILHQFLDKAHKLPPKADVEYYFRGLLAEAAAKMRPKMLTFRRALEEMEFEKAKGQPLQKEKMGHDASFVAHLYFLSKNLERKARQVREYSKNTSKVLDILRKIAAPKEISFGTDALNFTIGDTRLIPRDPFSLIVGLSGDNFRAVEKSPDTFGFHVRRTPISIVRRSSLEVTSAILHERLHNLTDGLITTADPVARFKKAIDTAEKASDLQNLSAEAYINDLQGEFVSASVHVLRYLSSNAPEELIRKILIPEGEGRYLSTASRQYEDLIIEIRSAREKKPELSDALDKFSVQLKEKFESTVRSIVNAASLLPELQDSIWARSAQRLIIDMCFLVPTQYHYLPLLVKRDLRSRRISKTIPKDSGA